MSAAIKRPQRLSGTIVGSALAAVAALLLGLPPRRGRFLPRWGQNQAVEACASTSSVNSSEGFFQL